MIIVVSGSREWIDKERIRKVILSYSPDLVIQGGARGADRLAREVCFEEGIDCETVHAKWERFGRAAGSIRNGEMLLKNPDLILAFWDGASPGTKNMIDAANKAGFDVDVQI